MHVQLTSFLTAMATNKGVLESPSRKLEFRLTCSICLELFENPKMMDCQHIFCRGCLSRLPIVVDKSRGDCLKCPNCRELTPLPDKGVSAMPSALVINQFLDLHQELLSEDEKEHAGKVNRAPCKDV